MAPAAIAVPQLFSIVNDVALLPPITTEVIATLVVPVFLRTATCAGLVTPTTVTGKAIVDGDRVTDVVPVVAVPDKLTS